MASIHTIMTDMRDSGSLIASRRSMDRDGSSAAGLQRQLADSIATKISKLPALSPADATHLLQAAQNCGQDEIGVQLIVAAIDARLGVSLDREDMKPASTTQMILTNVQSWVSESLMRTLRSKATIDIKLSVTAEYLANKLGCTHPHEQTYKHWLTLALLTHYDVWPKYLKVYQLLLQLKHEVKTSRKPRRFPRLRYTPRSRTNCTSARSSVYFTMRAQLSSTFPGSQSLQKNHVPLRKNSKLITNELKAGHASVSPKLERGESTSSLDAAGVPVKEEPDAEPNLPGWAQTFMTTMLQRFAPSQCAHPGEADHAQSAPLASHIPRPMPPAGLQPKGLQLRIDSTTLDKEPVRKRFNFVCLFALLVTLSAFSIHPNPFTLARSRARKTMSSRGKMILEGAGRRLRWSEI